MAEWKKTSLIDIVELIGGGTPKTSKSEYWGYQLEILTMRIDMFIPRKKVLQKKDLIIVQQNYSKKMTSLFQLEELLENWL